MIWTRASVESVRSRVEAELTVAGYAVRVSMADDGAGWPLVAHFRSADVGWVKLGEFDVEPVADESIESMANVIANTIRALGDERRQVP